MGPLLDIITSLCSSESVEVTQEEALDLAWQTNSEALYEATRCMTRHCMGDAFDTCSITNIESRHYSGDCRQCAQNTHYHTQVEAYPLLSVEPCVAESRANRQTGIGCIALVANERGQSDRKIERVAQHYKAMRQTSDIKLYTSMGLLTKEQPRRLYEADVTTYHYNMEGAPSHFLKLCTTHTQMEKKQTVRWVQEAGLQICSGGIIDMGETMAQRIELAYYLRSLAIHSIPVNILQPITGVPLAKEPHLINEEYLRTATLLRSISPTAFLCFSGGQLRLSPEVMRQAMYVGINNAITDNMLTTSGMQTRKDMQLIAEMGYRSTNEKDWRTEEIA